MPAENRERVLRAATSSFLARGYASSVDDIARRAGVAKQTVYAHFPSKDALFKEVAHDLTRRVLVELEGEPKDVRAGLVRFAVAYRERVLSAEGIATFRTVMPEVPRFRALERAGIGRGDGLGRERVAVAHLEPQQFTREGVDFCDHVRGAGRRYGCPTAGRTIEQDAR